MCRLVPVRQRCQILLLLFFITAMLVPRLVSAETAPSDAAAINAATRGSLLVRGAPGQALLPAPLVDTAVKIEVTGLVARVNVRQRFTNTSQQWQHGVYVFPLPPRAAVDGLRLEIGERVLEGQVKERAQARQIYETARDAGIRASLVEQQRPNLFTNSVANIGPGETVTVQIEYQQTVGYDAGWYSLRFPLTVGVRYIPGTTKGAGPAGGGWAANTDRVPDASSITPPMTVAGDGHDNPVSIDIGLAAGTPLSAIESPYHEVLRSQERPGLERLRLAQAAVPADRDFELRWKGTNGLSPRAALFSETHHDARYGLLMLMPPDVSGASVVPREIVYVIDTSGSMGGTSLEQARAALLYALGKLRPGDRFNIVQFNSVVDRFADEALVAHADNVRRAEAYVRRLVSTGGTEMAAALDAVLDGQTRSDRLRQVVFMTDGAVGNEAELLQIIDRRLGATRLFTVGIGAAPNSHFMQEAAANGRGTFTYIAAVDEVDAKMRALFEKLERPVLTDVHLEGDTSGLELWPDRISDLYADEPLMLSIRQDHALESMRLSGRFAGKPWSVEVPLTLGAAARGLDIEWARQKIAALERSLARGANAEDVARDITALGLQHRIVTRHTSLVAVDVTPARPQGAVAAERAVPNKLPAGWTLAPPAAPLPQTATPMAFNALIAVLLCLLSLCAWRNGRQARA